MSGVILWEKGLPLLWSTATSVGLVSPTWESRERRTVPASLLTTIVGGLIFHPSQGGLLE